jgi:hypothetical protein
MAFEEQSREFISLATLCLVTNPPCPEEQWRFTPESDLFEKMIGELTEEAAKNLLSYVIGVAIGVIEEVTSAAGSSAVEYLRVRALQIARDEN